MLAVVIHERGRKTLQVWETGRRMRIARTESFPDCYQYDFLPNSDILTAVCPRFGLLFLGIPSCKPLGTLEQPAIWNSVSSPAGNSVAIGNGNNTVETWELNRAHLGRKGLRKGQHRPAAQPPSQADMSRWYEALAGSDAKAARQCMISLEDAGDISIEFLEARLKPDTVDDAEMASPVRDLDSDDFSVRRQAAKKLEGLAGIAKTRLRERMEAAKSAEVQASLKRILVNADDYAIRDPERLRSVRAIECLEMVGSPRSRVVLVRLAGGARDSPVTKDAAAAIVRMDEWLSSD